MHAVIANGANFETAVSYALWDVALEKMSCGGRGFGLNPNRKAVAIGPRLHYAQIKGEFVRT